MPLIVSHTHLDFSQFDEGREAWLRGHGRRGMAEHKQAGSKEKWGESKGGENVLVRCW